MEKALRIEAFRNIGFKNKKPNTERLRFNNTYWSKQFRKN